MSDPVRVNVFAKDWRISRVGYAYSIQLGKMLQPEKQSISDIEVAYLKSQHVQAGVITIDDLPLMWANLTEISKYGVREGDLLVCEGGDVGRSAIVGEVPDDAIIQNALHRIRSSAGNSLTYLLYVMLHVKTHGWFDIICNKSTIAHLTREKLSALAIPLPPPVTQRAIAAHLDRETAKIDALIAKKRELIAKLKEQRSALISRVVTRGLPPEAAKVAGLDPNPPMKDSGVEWLGEVPKHWRVLPVKWFSTCASGESITSDEVSDSTEVCKIPVIGGNGIMGFAQTSNTASELIVIGRVGALCGNVHLVAPPAWITDNALRVALRGGVFDLTYLVSALRTRNLNELASRTAQPLLTGSQVGNQRMPCPPIFEQQTIAAFLFQNTIRFECMVEKIETAISRLTEYRAALITAAVTGQLAPE